MPEFLVSMDIAFPEGMPREEKERLLAAEAEAAKPYLDNGWFARAWRTYGDHAGNHGHLALWSGSDQLTFTEIADAYDSFPLVTAGCTRNWQATELLANPNDPASRMAQARKAMWKGYAPVPLTWDSLITLFDTSSFLRTHHGELPARRPVGPGITVHVHPESGNPRAIHFMVNDTKVAELGPSGPAPDGMHEDNVPGYVSFLAEWGGKPVTSQLWKDQIARDNGLLPASASSRLLIEGQ